VTRKYTSEPVPEKEAFLKPLSDEGIKPYIDFSPPSTYVVEFKREVNHVPVTVQADYWEETGKYYSFMSGDEDVVASFRSKDIFGVVKVGHVA
jgi:hypothetical protein